MKFTFTLTDYRPEDGGILDCWCDLCSADWLFVAGYDCWFSWHETHWQKDECQAIKRQIEALMNAMNRAAKAEAQQAALNKDEAGVKIFFAYVQATKRTKARIASVEGMAQARRAVAAGHLDSGNVLNLRNGTLDLDTITLRPHDQNDHLTYCLDYDYDPAAVAPRFEQFLQEVLVTEDDHYQTDIELCYLVQEALGYSLTNDMRQHAMFWLSGAGSNGKSVLIEVIKGLLGINAFSMNFSSLGTSDGNYRLANMLGKRVVFCTESQKNGTVAEEIMKQIADGSTIDARPIYGTPVQFESQAKIWWAQNDQPTIKDTSNGFWRRLRLIPFYRKFEEHEQDKTLPDKLRLELPGILNFCLDGLRRLRQRGRLPESKAVADAIAEYRRSSNPVWQWLDEQTVKSDTAWTLQSTLYLDYTAWCVRNGRQGYNNTNFGKELKRLVLCKRINAGVVYAVALTV